MGQLEDTVDEKINWHWRNSMRPVRFFTLDARAAIPFFITLFHFRIWTLAITIILTVFFVLLERRGLTFDASLRAMRSWVTGQKRHGWISYRRKKMVDYG